MRDFKGMKRQRGRNRSGGSSGGKPQQQNANRAFDSNGPEGVKVRGAAQHVFEKYQQLARDASTAGDRVLAENYLQHAEHYFRLLRAMQPNRPATEFLVRDQFSSGFDIDFEDEGAQAQAQAADEAAAEAQLNNPQAEADSGERPAWQGDRPREDRQDRQRDDRQRDDRPRDDRPRNFDNQNGQQRNRWREDRPDRNADRPRDDRPRDDRPRDDRPRDDRPRDEQRPREDRPREDRQRDDRPRDDRPREDRAQREDRAPREDRPQREERAPREDRIREERPEVEERRGPVLRDSDGGESHAPAFLSAAPAPRPEIRSETGEEEPVRRRRAPRVAKPARDRDTEEA